MTGLITPLEDLDLLLDSLGTRVRFAARSPIEAVRHLGVFCEDLEGALVASELLKDLDNRGQPKRQPRDWHADPGLKPYGIKQSTVQAFQVAYGYRNTDLHSNQDLPTNAEEIWAQYIVLKGATHRLLTNLEERYRDVVEALFEVQNGDREQLRARGLLTSLERIEEESKDAFTGLLLREASRQPLFRSALEEPVPSEQIRAVVRRLATLAGDARGQRPLVEVVRVACSDPRVRRSLEGWLSATQSELGGHDPNPVQRSPELESGALFHVVRVVLTPGGVGIHGRLPESVTLDEISLRGAWDVPADVTRSALGLPRRVRVSDLSDEICRAWQTLGPFVRGVRRGGCILQVAVPAAWTYLDALDAEALWNWFWCVTVAPQVHGRNPTSIAHPIANPLRNPDEACNALAMDELLDSSGLCRRLQRRREPFVDCLIAAPALVTWTEGCPAVAAFQEHGCAVHFRSEGLQRYVEELFGAQTALPFEDLLQRVGDLSQEGLRVLWDDERYNDPLPVSLD